MLLSAGQGVSRSPALLCRGPWARLAGSAASRAASAAGVAVSHVSHTSPPGLWAAARQQRKAAAAAAAAEQQQAEDDWNIDTAGGRCAVWREERTARVQRAEQTDDVSCARSLARSPAACAAHGIRARRLPYATKQAPTRCCCTSCCTGYVEPAGTARHQPACGWILVGASAPTTACLPARHHLPAPPKLQAGAPADRHRGGAGAPADPSELGQHCAHVRRHQRAAAPGGPAGLRAGQQKAEACRTRLLAQGGSSREQDRGSWGAGTAGGERDREGQQRGKRGGSSAAARGTQRGVCWRQPSSASCQAPCGSAPAAGLRRRPARFHVANHASRPAACGAQVCVEVHPSWEAFMDFWQQQPGPKQLVGEPGWVDAARARPGGPARPCKAAAGVLAGTPAS